MRLYWCFAKRVFLFLLKKVVSTKFCQLKLRSKSLQNSNYGKNLYISYEIVLLDLTHFGTLMIMKWFDLWLHCTAQKIKFATKDFFSKCDQIRKKLRIWSHLLKKFLMENFIFLCSVGDNLASRALFTHEQRSNYFMGLFLHKKHVFSVHKLQTCSFV